MCSFFINCLQEYREGFHNLIMFHNLRNVSLPDLPPLVLQCVSGYRNHFFYIAVSCTLSQFEDHRNTELEDNITSPFEHSGRGHAHPII